MINSLFSIKNQNREKIYKCFINLPAPVKSLIAKHLCQIYKIRINRLKTPLKLVFYVTNKCNLKCGHCFYSKYLNKGIDKELNLEEIKLFVSSLRHKLFSITLTGGEPFLRHDLAGICEIFSKLNKTQMITIATNGFFPEVIEKTVKEILEEVNYYVNIQISIDGLEKTHDKIRGITDSFRRAVDTVTRCKRLKEKFPNLNLLSVSTTVSNVNYNEVEQLIDFVKLNLKVFHKFQLIRDCRVNINSIDKDILSDLRAQPGSFELPGIPELYKLKEVLSRSYDEENNFLISRLQFLYMEYCLDIIRQKKKIFLCLAGRFDGVIFPSGNVAVCEMTMPFGNLRETGLDFFKLWNSEAADRRRAEIKDCFCIHPCNIFTSIGFDKNTLVSLCSKN